MDKQKAAESRANAMRLTRETLDAFKRACPENEQIAEIVRRHLVSWIEEPVADIGAGRGDIALNALAGLTCVQVDRLDFSDYAISPKHRRLQRDVFATSSEELGTPRTLILSHVFQYLDDDPKALGELLDGLGAQKLVVVVNKNVGALARFIGWSTKNLRDSNPEVDVDVINKSYICVGEWPFSVSIFGDHPSDLAHRLLHLVDVADTPANIKVVLRFLRDEGITTTFTFDQVVRAYERRS